MAIVAAATSLALTACQEGPETIVEEAREDDFTEAVVGDDVEVTAPVDEMITPHAFRLLDTLVVTGEACDIPEDRRVAVRGTIAELSVTEAEEQLGVDLGEEVEDLEGELAILATDVESLVDGDVCR